MFLVMAGVSVVSGLLLTSRAAHHSSLEARFLETPAGLAGFTTELEFRAESASALTEVALNTSLR